MRKPMVKAMACALAFTMVATTPLSASASGIAGLYNSGENKTATKTTTETEVLGGNPVDKIEHTDKDGNLNSTGTTTFTTTNTNGLDSLEGGQDNEKYIIGVSFDKDVVDIEAGEETELVATVLFNDGTTFQYNAEKGGADASLKDLLVFRKIMTNDEGQSLSAGSVAYAYDQTAGGMDIVKRDTLKVRGIHGGSFYIQAALKTDKSGEYKYFDVVAVNVKEYSEKLIINELPELYVKHVYNLNDSLTRVSETSNDKITWSAYEIDAKKGTEKNTKAVKVTEDGMMTVNKAFTADSKVYVRAVSETGVEVTKALEAFAGNPITQLKYSVDKDEKDIKAVTIGWGKVYNKKDKTYTDLDETADVTVRAFVANPDKSVSASRIKNIEDFNDTTTDDITWSSKNTNVADVVVSDDDETATIVAKGVGSTTITAKATSGKKITYKVTVKAPLESLSIADEAGNVTGKIYVGQSIQLVADKDPAASKDKITWKVVGKKNAKVDKNGKVTALVTNDTKTNPETTVEIQASFKNQEGKTVTSNVYTLTIKKSDIDADKLTLIDKNVLPEDKTVDYDANDGSIKKDKIFVGKDDTYSALKVTNKGDAISESDFALVEQMLSWSSSKTKVATVNDGYTEAVGAGKANVTASFVNVKGKTVKAIVAVTAPQAVTKLQLKQTEFSVAAGAKKDTAVSVQVSKQLPKNATKENITWSIEADEANAAYFSFPVNKKTGAEINTGNKVKVNVSKDAPTGATATVRATAANGATTTATITVTYKTAKVAFRTDVTSAAKPAQIKDVTLTVGNNSAYTVKTANNATETVTTKLNVKAYTAVISGDEKKGTDVHINEAGNETVSYSVNKAGIVTIGRDGTIYPVKAGTVKITAKTPSGKKATLTVKVVNPVH